MSRTRRTFPVACFRLRKAAVEYGNCLKCKLWSAKRASTAKSKAYQTHVLMTLLTIVFLPLTCYEIFDPGNILI